MAVRPIPEGYSAVTPYLVVQGVEDLIRFLEQAFGAKTMVRMPGSKGETSHAEVKIGDSIVMMGEASDPASRTSAGLHLYVEDVDAAYARALAAGATSIREPADQFYGDRTGGVRDMCGNQWYIATHVEDVSPDELARRAAQAR